MLNILLNTFLSNKSNINLHSQELNMLLLHLAHNFANSYFNNNKYDISVFHNNKQNIN